MAKKVTLEIIEALKTSVEKKFFRENNLDEREVDQAEIYEFSLDKIDLQKPSLLQSLNRNAKVHQYLKLTIKQSLKEN